MLLADVISDGEPAQLLFARILNISFIFDVRKMEQETAEVTGHEPEARGEASRARLLGYRSRARNHTFAFRQIRKDHLNGSIG